MTDELARLALETVPELLRDDFHTDALEALDSTERLYRKLQKADAAALGMHPNALAELTHRVKKAYDTLAAVRIVSDWRRA